MFVAINGRAAVQTQKYIHVRPQYFVSFEAPRNKRVYYISILTTVYNPGLDYSCRILYLAIEHLVCLVCKLT